MSEPLIPGGYILIARKLRKSPTWQCLTLKQRIVALELLLQAKHTAGFVSRNGEKVWLEAGQIATSYQNIVDDIALSEITPKVIRCALVKFKKLGFTAQEGAKEGAKKGLLITVVNWDFYQCPDNYRGKAKGIDKGKAGAKQGQSRGKAGAINNNVNNVNKGNKVKKDTIYSSEFESWYKQYPRSQAKADSFKNFEKVRKEEGMEIILKATANYIKHLNKQPDKRKAYEFAYSSNNFFGKSAYYKDFLHREEDEYVPYTGEPDDDNWKPYTGD